MHEMPTDRSSAAEARDLFQNPATEVSSLLPELNYRGYPVDQLADQANYVDVAWLLLHGDLPTQEQLADFQSLIVEQAVPEDDLLARLELLPLHVPGSEVLQTAVSMLSLDDSESHELIPATTARILQRLLSQLPVIVACRQRARHGEGWLMPRDELTYAANILWLFSGREASTLQERALDRLMILAAEHEFGEATVAVRLAASVRADFYAAVVAGLSVFRGALQGGMTDPILHLWRMFDSVETTRAWIRASTAASASFPGFEHRAYRTSDPRAEALRPICRELAAAAGRLADEAIAEAIEEEVWEARQVLPTFLWPAVRVLSYLGLDGDAMVPILATSRLGGWAAHYTEQLQQGAVRRLRSPESAKSLRRYQPLDERG
jgi:citrate synthase